MNIRKIDEELLEVIEKVDKIEQTLIQLGNSDIAVDLNEANKNLQWAYHLYTRQYA